MLQIPFSLSRITKKSGDKKKRRAKQRRIKNYRNDAEFYCFCMRWHSPMVTRYKMRNNIHRKRNSNSSVRCQIMLFIHHYHYCCGCCPLLFLLYCSQVVAARTNLKHSRLHRQVVNIIIISHLGCVVLPQM